THTPASSPRAAYGANCAALTMPTCRASAPRSSTSSTGRATAVSAVPIALRVPAAQNRPNAPRAGIPSTILSMLPCPAFEGRCSFGGGLLRDVELPRHFDPLEQALIVGDRRRRDGEPSRSHARALRAHLGGADAWPQL